MGAISLPSAVNVLRAGYVMFWQDPTQVGGPMAGTQAKACAVGAAVLELIKKGRDGSLQKDEWTKVATDLTKVMRKKLVLSYVSAKIVGWISRKLVGNPHVQTKGWISSGVRKGGLLLNEFCMFTSLSPLSARISPLLARGAQPIVGAFSANVISRVACGALNNELTPKKPTKKTTPPIFSDTQDPHRMRHRSGTRTGTHLGGSDSDGENCLGGSDSDGDTPPDMDHNTDDHRRVRSQVAQPLHVAGGTNVRGSLAQLGDTDEELRLDGVRSDSQAVGAFSRNGLGEVLNGVSGAIRRHGTHTRKLVPVMSPDGKYIGDMPVDSGHVTYTDKKSGIILCGIDQSMSGERVLTAGVQVDLGNATVHGVFEYSYAPIVDWVSRNTGRSWEQLVGFSRPPLTGGSSTPTQRQIEE